MMIMPRIGSPRSQASLPFDILFILAGLCSKDELLSLRLVSRHFNEICVPFLYTILVQKILRDQCLHLHRAAAICYDIAIRRLLEKGAPLTQCNALGETALHIAVRGNCVIGVARFLQAQVSVDVRTIHGWTPLQLAARHGHDVVVTMLLRHGASLDLQGFHGWTALHYAARAGHFVVVKKLTEAGARVDITDNDGLTAVDEARRFGHQSTLASLLSTEYLTDQY